MARFDLYPNPSGGWGYVLDVQSDLLEGLNTRMVVPLMGEAMAPLPARRLNPVFEIEGLRHVMVTQFMAAVPTSALGASCGTLAREADQITAALDMLTQGF